MVVYRYGYFHVFSFTFPTNRFFRCHVDILLLQTIDGSTIVTGKCTKLF